MTTHDEDHPGVVGLPPFLYLAALVLGFLLHAVWPIRIPGPPTALMTVGALLIVASLALAVWGRVTLVRAGTNVNPRLPTTTIVTGGPYRFTRNPLYLSLTAIVLGIALATRAGWPAVLLAPLVVLMHVGVVLREERYLERKFGATYTSYRDRVRRYL